MKQRVSMSIDEELIAYLRAIAEQEGRSVSNLIEYLLKKALADIS